MSTPWKESGAMVYVALTVAIFSAVTMCCVGVAKRQRAQTTYTSVEEEDMELTRVEQSDTRTEEIVFEQKGHIDDSSAFTLDDSDDEEPNTPQGEQTTPV
jgi:hypothetical protein